MKTVTNEIIYIFREANTLDSVRNTNTKDNDKDSEEACTQLSLFIRRDTKAKQALNMVDKPLPKLQKRTEATLSARSLKRITADIINLASIKQTPNIKNDPKW